MHKTRSYVSKYLVLLGRCVFSGNLRDLGGSLTTEKRSAQEKGASLPFPPKTKHGHKAHKGSQWI